MEMETPRGHPTTRRRAFTGVGRYPETLQTARAELNNEGTDYLLLSDSPAPPPPLLAIVHTLLVESQTPLTGRQLLARWPGAAPCPNRIWRTLSRGVERGLFTVSGTGTKTDAFRYGVVGQAKAQESTGADQQAAADAG
jgi:hypothetical protein